MNLRTWTIAVISLIATLFAPTSLADDYVEGKHFTVIGAPSEQNTLTEYYSVFCPACYQFAPLMRQLKETLGEGVTVQYKHVTFMNHAPVEVQKELTLLLDAAFEISDDEGTAFQAWLFEQIHKEKWRPSNTDAVWRHINQRGVSKTILEKANSPAFREQLPPYLYELSQLVDSGAIKGTPTLIVDGAYRIEVGGLNKADPFGDLVKLIQYLMNKE